MSFLWNEKKGPINGQLMTNSVDINGEILNNSKSGLTQEKILVLGSFSRENASKFLKSTKLTKIYVVPGNGGIRAIEHDRTKIERDSLFNINDNDSIVKWCKDNGIKLVICLLKDPIMSGIANKLLNSGILCCAPQQEAAQILFDKSLAKDFMTYHKIPNITSEDTSEERLLKNDKVSILTFTDGNNFKTSLISKLTLGPNKEVISAYCPYPFINARTVQMIDEEIIRKIIDGLKKEGKPFVGLLNTKLMITENGPKMIEFDFGDLEVQSVLELLGSDLYELCLACAQPDPTQQTLNSINLEWSNKNAYGVVVATEGDLNEPMLKKQLIEGVNIVKNNGLHVFFDDIELRRNTSGGRILTVFAVESDLRTAAKNAHEAASRITKKRKEDMAPELDRTFDFIVLYWSGLAGHISIYIRDRFKRKGYFLSRWPKNRDLQTLYKTVPRVLYQTIFDDTTGGGKHPIILTISSLFKLKLSQEDIYKLEEEIRKFQMDGTYNLKGSNCIKLVVQFLELIGIDFGKKTFVFPKDLYKWLISQEYILEIQKETVLNYDKLDLLLSLYEDCLEQKNHALDALINPQLLSNWIKEEYKQLCTKVQKFVEVFSDTFKSIMSIQGIQFDKDTLDPLIHEYSELTKEIRVYKDTENSDKNKKIEGSLKDLSEKLRKIYSYSNSDLTEENIESEYNSYPKLIAKQIGISSEGAGLINIVIEIITVIFETANKIEKKKRREEKRKEKKKKNIIQSD